MAVGRHELYDKISLDRISGYLLDDMQKPGPPFLMECEKNIIKEVKAYTEYIINQGLSSRCDTVPIVENHAGELLDSICESNRSYFESGIKTGALLLMQLLDL